MPRNFNDQLIDWHGHLIALLKAMGHPYNEAGVCFGIAATLSAAHLAGKMVIYAESLNALSHADPTTINTPNHGLTHKEYTDVLALLDSIALVQETEKSIHLFPPVTDFLDQNAGLIEVYKILKLKEKEDNGIVQVHTLCKAVEYRALSFSITRLCDAFKELEQSNTPVAFLISKLGHTISCNYNPILSVWLCIDANKRTPGFSPIFMIDSPQGLTNFIWTSQVQRFNEKEMCVIDTQILCKASDLDIMKDSLYDWKKVEGKYLRAAYIEDLNPEALRSMFSLAIRIGDIEVVDAILEASVDGTIYYDNPGAIRDAIIYGRDEILHHFLEEGIDQNRIIPGTESLWKVAMDFNRIEAVNILLNDIVTDKDFTHSNLGCLLFNFVCEHGRLDIVKELIRCRGLNINDQDQNGDTALHCAVRSGNLDLVKFMINHPLINPNIGDSYYNTAYHLAMMISDNAGNANEVRRFRAIAQTISNHPDFEIDEHNDGDPGLIFYYVNRGDTKKIDKTLWKGGYTSASRDQNDHTILYYAAKHSPQLHLKLLNYFKIDKDLCLDALAESLDSIQMNEWRNYRLDSLPSLHILRTMPELLNAYLDQGVSALDNDPFSSLAPYAETLQTLIEIERNDIVIPDSTSEELSLLEIAIITNHEDLIDILLRNTDICLHLNSTDDMFYKTPLSHAIENDRHDIAMKLVRAGSRLEDLYAHATPAITPAERKLLGEMTRVLRDDRKFQEKAADYPTLKSEAISLDNKYGTKIHNLLDTEMNLREKNAEKNKHNGGGIR